MQFLNLWGLSPNILRRKCNPAAYLVGAGEKRLHPLSALPPIADINQRNWCVRFGTSWHLLLHGVPATSA
jgi:hypothetical protein